MTLAVDRAVKFQHKQTQITFSLLVYVFNVLKTRSAFNLPAFPEYPSIVRRYPSASLAILKFVYTAYLVVSSQSVNMTFSL